MATPPNSLSAISPPPNYSFNLMPPTPPPAVPTPPPTRLALSMSSMSDDLPPLMPLVNSSSSGSNGSRGSSVLSSPATPSELKAVAEGKRPDFYLIDKITSTELPDGERTVNNFVIGKKLGSGAFATVRVATDSNTGIKYAIKKMSKASLRKKREFAVGADGKMKMTNALEKVQKEVDIMRQVWHQNVVPLFGVMDDPNEDSLYLVTELEARGQIMDWDSRALQYKSKHYPPSAAGGIAEEQLRPLLRGMAHGLAALHAQRIIHRDIKPDNVLLSATGLPKIADFGTAKQFPEGDTEGKVSDSAGTFHFFSPESCSGEYYSGYTTDVWALGVTLYCCVFGRVPWMSKDNNPQELFDKIQHQEWTVPDGATISSSLYDLLTSFLQKDPTKRITLAQIDTHPWITTAPASSSASAK